MIYIELQQAKYRGLLILKIEYSGRPTKHDNHSELF